MQWTSGVSYAPYAYGTIIRTIRDHMRIRVWYVPYAYGINTRMVQNIYIYTVPCTIWVYTIKYEFITLLVDAILCFSFRPVDLVEPEVNST